ncbi:BNR repeat-containing family member [Lentzea xinjiangensis]|uniref:BNR repeat-containing family member n=1 Tax=Lentzea xinjiangensis TaxID=402600 RepID=A0A1H9LTH9_9PSEU|nr:BNR repeat-containing protein [Lentzea xinjiangensis]SER14628.1 BNR repeat-containing family member [Lentzea xinjiangensis]
MTRILLTLLAVLFLVPGTAHAEPRVSLVSDTLLDASALYFVSYDGLVNNNSFQQDAILTYEGRQYAAWYTASRNAVIARRDVGSTRWESVVLSHRLGADDSHNVISLGISPQDNTIHVAMDTHNTRLFYLRSEPGLAIGALPWNAAAFGEVRLTLGGVELGPMTYPRFVVTPEGGLQFSYRTGGSGNGVNELAEYSGGTWRKLGAWTSATGPYTGPNGVVSTTRNMYLHGLTYDRSGRLHAAFTWREGNPGVLCNSGGLTNHDTGYVYSDDRGRTWRNGGGAVVGTTGGTPVGIGSPGLVADPLDPNHGLMNQESQAVDARGRPHVVISYVPGRFTQCVSDYARQRAQHGRVFHVFRNADGTWTKREVPVPPEHTQRTKVVFDREDNVYLVMPRGRIVAASASSGWTDWTTLFDRPSLRAFGEVNVDASRLVPQGVLSVQYQQTSSGTTPSPIRVADFRLGP